MKLIINADDYGLNDNVTAAIAEAFERKLVTDTTACSNADGFEKAVYLAKQENFSDRVGIHLNVTEGKPLTDDIAKNPFYCDNDGVFHGKIKREVTLTRRDKQDLYNELEEQIVMFEQNGIHPNHADSHHHIHTAPFFYPIISELLKKYAINKIRISRNIGDVSFVKNIYKNMLNNCMKNDGFITTDVFGSLSDYKKVVKTLLTGELMVHPGYDTIGRLIDINKWNYPVFEGVPLVDLSDVISNNYLQSYNLL